MYNLASTILCGTAMYIIIIIIIIIVIVITFIIIIHHLDLLIRQTFYTACFHLSDICRIRQTFFLLL